ncbi:hypothetical protein XENORESO_006143 [Xenotaenia resolanae]|uniref:Uncharacterized protein n=1 Tax=Xenotaenia resolanae TaxID=208358 RepID=A0ABV0X1L2_9TELE
MSERSGSHGSQRPHLDDISLRGISGLGGNIKLLEVIAGDDEDNGGGVEGNPLLGSVPGVARVGHDDGSDGALGGRQGALFEVFLQPGDLVEDSRAEQLQEVPPELGQEEVKKQIRGNDDTVPGSPNL